MAINYDQTLEFLYSQLPAYHRIGKAAYKDNLNNSLALDSYLGHPHKSYKTIHIAGTNGKGSVSHMVASILMEAGYRAGLYTSPHLLDFRERIKVNGKMIPKREVTRFVRRISSFTDDIKPSFFEMTVALAFDYFAESKVDFAVIEAGLGGRLDSTNIIDPVISVITNIGHDHMDLLGNSLEKIASEKAGIIKRMKPVVVGETTELTQNIFTAHAAETESEIIFADQYYGCYMDDSNNITSKRGYCIEVKQSGKTITGETDLTGDYQQKNIQTVFGAIKVLRNSVEISDNAILHGIGRVKANTGLMGRWQIIGRNPVIICDTGHNQEGLEYVINQLKRIPGKKLHIVLGFVSDKDRNSLLPVFPSSATYYFTKALVPRALDERILKMEAARWDLKGECYSDVKSAMDSARASASEDDLIFIGGSTFIVADALINQHEYGLKKKSGLSHYLPPSL